jgi:hypothetical protein
MSILTNTVIAAADNTTTTTTTTTTNTIHIYSYSIVSYRYGTSHNVI